MDVIEFDIYSFYTFLNHLLSYIKLKKNTWATKLITPIITITLAITFERIRDALAIVACKLIVVTL